MPKNQADDDLKPLREAARRASGYLDLAIMFKESGVDHNQMRLRAIAELQSILDDDDYIDRLMEADYREMEEEEEERRRNGL